ncbi:MAG: ferritin family protein [Candidatus Omnitrophica bacterium]|nr:ferritin family protein [Candidatus Omnitrophota bacterium]
MGDIFAGSEIVEIGIQIEKNGRDFYNALVGKTKSPKAADIFKYLAKEEEKHIKAFEGILNKLDQYRPAEAYPGEYFTYMQALAGEHIFTKKGQGVLSAKSIASDRVAIEAGVGFEQDSIVFYSGMKRVVPAYDQKVIEELIAQEENHLRQLLELKRQI